MTWLWTELARRVEASLHRRVHPGDLLQAVYRQALRDLLPWVCGGQVSEDLDAAPPPEKGRVLSAALFLASLDTRAEPVVRQIAAKLSLDEAEELLLYAEYGVRQWQEELPRRCFRCGIERQEVAWYPLLTPPKALPAAWQWRYRMPENHVPLCLACAKYLKRASGETWLSPALWGAAVWGARFDAWTRLHAAFMQGHLPAWGKSHTPLWPEWMGGTTWMSGKGVVLFRYPLLWTVRRTQQHRRAAAALLQKYPLRRKAKSLLVAVAQGKGRR